MPKCEANCAVNKLITDVFLRNFCLFEVQLKYLRSQLDCSAVGVETLMVSAAFWAMGEYLYLPFVPLSS